MYRVADALIRMMAPILVHTADEAWLALRGESMDSESCVHLQAMPEAVGVRAPSSWTAAMQIRAEILRSFETAKESMGISNPLDAGVRVVLPEGEAENLGPVAHEMADLCGMSRFMLLSGSERKVEIIDLRSELRCERSWKRDGTVRERADGGMLSDRDAAAVGLG